MNQETTNAELLPNFFKELNKSIEIIGIKKLIEILRYSRKTTEHLSEEQISKVNSIIELVCDEFGITLEEFFSTSRKNNRRHAIGACALFFQNNIGMDNCDISYVLKKPESITSAYKNDILLLKSNHPIDVKILQKIENIKIKLNNNQDGK